MQTQHVFQRMNTDDADKDLQPTEYRSSKHLMTANDAYSKGFRREVIKGNEPLGLIDSLSNQSKCIGTHEDRVNNRIVYFIVDPEDSSKSGIYQFKNGTISKILNDNGFDFNINKKITQVSFTDHYMLFIDTDNIQYYFDTKRALETNELNNVNAKYLRLIKPRPFGIPSVDSVNNVFGITQNKVVFDSYKFFVRFIYKDETKTVISNASKLMSANDKPRAGQINNGIEVEYDLTYFQHKQLIDKIQFLYEKNDTGIYYEFDDLKVLTSENKYSTIFTGYESSTPLNSIDSIKVFDSVPVRSNAGSVVKSVAFINSFENDYDNEGNYDINLEIDFYEVSGTSISFGEGDKARPIAKSGGSYSVGIAFYDEDQRLSPILKKKNITIPVDFPEPTIIGFIVLARIKAKITGSMPSWATSYQLFITEENKISAYFQSPANALYYLSDFQEDQEVGTNEFVYGTAIYSNEKPSDDVLYPVLHLQIPNNVPFIPDNECIVRVLDNDSIPKSITEGVINVRGDVIVVENFGLNNADKLNEAFPNGNQNLTIEVFKNESEIESIFYSYPEIYNINGTEDRTVLISESDTFRVNASHSFTPMSETASNSTFYELGELTFSLRRFSSVESPTPTIQPTKSATLSTASIKKSYPEFDDSVTDLIPREGENVSRKEELIARGLVFGGPVGLVVNLINRKRRIESEEARTLEIERTTSFNSGNILDYQKSVTGFGFPNVYFDNYKKVNQSTVIFYSNPYIQNSSVNGIGSFDQGNRVELPIERGKVTCLFPTDIDSSSVLLAFHDRNVTSIYVGEGFVRQGNDNILAKTEGVIGDERILIGGYGTVNPESVVIHNGRVYFWDLRAGEPIRYSRAGLAPLGTIYKVRKEFNKWQKILQNLNPENYKVNSGFDPLNNIFYISFPTVGENQGETYLFSENDQNEGWITKLEIEPDIFAKNNNDLYSFKNGQIYIHNSDVRATFYGEQKEANITFVHNEIGASEKIYDNIVINSNAPWNVDLKNRRGQETDLVYDELEWRDETFYGDFLRDKNTPEDQLSEDEVGLLHGNIIKDQIATIKLSLNTDENVYIDDVGVGFTMASGHNNKAKK